MDYHFRYRLKRSDKKKIRELLLSTGFFYDYEVQVAIDIVELTLRKGDESSGYHFVIAEHENKVLGFSCYGAAPCTTASYDIYWFAVHKASMNKGLGSKILMHTEAIISGKGGRNIWIETSSRPTYAPTRAFYQKKNYVVQAELPDFYAPGDNKIIFRKNC
ncbi:MAG: GNAT family N-acetyltransferase [Bacteroidales bacterium]|nr:GNAT family N-acetyltransferase [Bacteroidales bacterium]